MRKLSLGAFVTWVVLASPNSWAVTSLLGDKDGFGAGLQAGDLLPASDPFFDNREPDDPEFTDNYPAGALIDGLHTIEYTHTYAPLTAIPSSATLSLFTLGIQDGDDQVLGSDGELLLFIDGIEVPNAFDTVDQFDYFPEINGWADFAGLVDIDIPTDLLDTFVDGQIQVRLESFDLLRPNAYEGMAIDYSEIAIDAVPIPPTLYLFGTGLLGLLGMARRKAA